jgi:hypothetical protein
MRVPADDVALTDAELAAMNADERAAAAASLKARGNTAYQQRSFERAAELYTRAIAASPLPEPVFYSNRAACTRSSLTLPSMLSLTLPRRLREHEPATARARRCRL